MSQAFIHQIRQPGAFLETSDHAEFKTGPKLANCPKIAGIMTDFGRAVL